MENQVKAWVVVLGGGVPREIPRPAGENAGLRDDLGAQNWKTAPTATRMLRWRVARPVNDSPPKALV